MLVTSMGTGVTHFHRADDVDSTLQFVIMVDSSAYAGAATLFRVARPEMLRVVSEGGLKATWVGEHGALLAVWTHK